MGSLHNLDVAFPSLGFYMNTEFRETRVHDLDVRFEFRSAGFSQGIPTLKGQSDGFIWWLLFWKNRYF